MVGQADAVLVGGLGGGAEALAEREEPVPAEDGFEVALGVELDEQATPDEVVDVPGGAWLRLRGVLQQPDQ